jgi:hypothetical protein
MKTIAKQALAPCTAIFSFGAVPGTPHYIFCAPAPESLLCSSEAYPPAAVEIP